MVKGNRKRANEPSKSPKMGKAKPLVTKESLLKDYPIRTLNQSDVNRFKEMVNLSNNVAGLLKQCVDADMSIEKGNDVAKQMMSGKIKGPAMQKITSNLYLPLVDMKDVAKKIKGEVEMLKQANLISRKQLSQRYDEYIDSMRNLKLILDALLANAPEKKMTTIRGDRKVFEQTTDVEQEIFRKEVDKLTKEDKEYLKSIQEKIDNKATEKTEVPKLPDKPPIQTVDMALKEAKKKK